jgi:hypothetical protein
MRLRRGWGSQECAATAHMLPYYTVRRHCEFYTGQWAMAGVHFWLLSCVACTSLFLTTRLRASLCRALYPVLPAVLFYSVLCCAVLCSGSGPSIRLAPTPC